MVICLSVNTCEDGSAGAVHLVLQAPGGGPGRAPPAPPCRHLLGKRVSLTARTTQSHPLNLLDGATPGSGQAVLRSHKVMVIWGFWIGQQFVPVLQDLLALAEEACRRGAGGPGAGTAASAAPPHGSAGRRGRRSWWRNWWR